MSINEDLDKIERFIENIEDNKLSEIQELLIVFFKNHKRMNRIEKFIGDFPTFIEPIYLGDNVSIGDDVLLGPNVYIADNVEIGNFVEISNSIIFKNSKIGENFKLENCIVEKNSYFNFKNLKLRNHILRGIANSIDEIDIIEF